MAGIVGDPLGPPTPAKPLGEESYDAVSAPLSATVGVRIPEREQDATARWDPPDDDEPDEPDLTPRHLHAP